MSIWPVPPSRVLLEVDKLEHLKMEQVFTSETADNLLAEFRGKDIFPGIEFSEKAKKRWRLTECICGNTIFKVILAEWKEMLICSSCGKIYDQSR